MALDKIIGDSQSFIDRQLGTSISGKGNFGAGKPKLPWSLEDEDEVFWEPLDIKPERWDKLYPYRLVVIDIKNPDKIVGGSGGTLKSKKSKNANSPAGIEYVITQEIQNGSWEFTLPITPQMLRISDQYAISTTATMRGVIEEHGGVRFKTISASGTTGIWTQRPTVGGIPKSPTAIGSIFGGSLNQFSNILGDIKRIQKSFSGTHPASVSNAKSPADLNNEFSTGYYQAHLLSQFLERYVQAKKNPKNKNWRLVFDIPKQNQSFIVTPQSFTLEQNQQRPMEALWSIQLKAWKRISLESPEPLGQLLPKLDSNAFQRITNTLRETRRILGNSMNLVKAVRSDAGKPLNILRQTALAVKDLGGLIITAADLPQQLLNDYESSVKDSLAIIASSFKRGPSGISGNGTSATGVTSSSLKSSTQEARAGAVAGQILSQSANNEGLSQDAVASGALGLGAAQALETSTTNNAFSSPESHFDLFDAIDLDSLSLSPEQQELVDDEIESVSLITIGDLLEYKAEIESLAFDIANNFGAGDETFSEIYGKAEKIDRSIPMSLEENEILLSLYDAVQAYDELTSDNQYDDFSISSPLAFVGGLANESGISFDESISKFLVPVPFGLTIEDIAARYLGDPDKWIEIATINKLSSPYIDEVGFVYSLLSNGDGRQINVNDQDNNLYIGQKVVLRSSIVPQFSRKIINIERISDTNYLISLDGEADLDNLTTAAGATLQGYMPNTTNSQNQIYIPSNSPASEDDRVRTPSHLDEDLLTKISKIDWLLDDNGDLAINQLGEFRLANGLNNLIQALKIKIRTRKGTLLRHLDFGFGISHGISISDIDSGNLISELDRMIKNDSRFSGIERLEIRLQGSALKIEMSVKIASSSGIIPITFDI